jgi:integrative and conjugative element protein (TIGR02256 family)
LQKENKSIIICNGEIKLQIDDSIIDKMLKYRQLHFSDKESGGILLGRKSKMNDFKFIDCITTPFPGDRASKYMFKRRDGKHIDFYREVNKGNGFIYSYEGEWHTHPEDFPDYSSIDKKNWIKSFFISLLEERLLVFGL